MRSGVSTWAFALLFTALAASSAVAQDDGDWEPHDRVAAGQIQPLDRLLPEVRRSHPGTFYDAEGPFAGPDGEMHYRLKWMTPDGRIVWYDADARTGRVMGSSSGRRDYQSFDTGPAGEGDGRRYRDDDNGGRDRFPTPGYNGGYGEQGPPDFGGRGHGNGWGGRDWGGRGGWGGHGGWGGGHGGWGGGHGGGGGHHGGRGGF